MKKNKIINFLLLGMLIVLVSASLIGCQNKDNENSNNEVAETESNRGTLPMLRKFLPSSETKNSTSLGMKIHEACSCKKLPARRCWIGRAFV